MLAELREWDKKNVPVEIVVVGRKAASFFRRIKDIKAEVTDLGDRPHLEDLIGTIKVMLDDYREGNIDRLFLMGNEFVNTMTQRPDIQQLLPVPEGVGMDVAVCCPVQGLTAHYLTTDAHAGLVRPGEWMLIHGVGGGTCQWAAQMAKIMGYKVIGTTSESKEAIGRATGVDELIVLKDAPGASYEDYASVDIPARVAEITGGAGVKAVIDGVGLATWEISLASLGRRGIFVSFGNASGTVPAFEPLKLIGKSLFLTRPKLLDYVQDRDALVARSSEVFGWIREGKLKVSVDRAFPLDEAAEGHKYLESGASTGKVLYRID